MKNNLNNSEFHTGNHGARRKGDNFFQLLKKINVNTEFYIQPTVIQYGGKTKMFSSTGSSHFE